MVRGLRQNLLRMDRLVLRPRQHNILYTRFHCQARGVECLSIGRPSKVRARLGDVAVGHTPIFDARHGMLE